MSNNIYDILKKMAGLEAPKQSLTESKSMDTVKELHKESKKEPMTGKGSIAEAVKTVESQLNEKYMGFKKTVAAIKKGGSAENPEAVAAAIGRKKYGKEKFQKAAAAGKKLGEGIADLFVDTEKMAQQKAKADQNFADRSAKHFASQVGDQYHQQLIKTNPAYRDEYMSQVKDVRSPEVMKKIEKELQAKYDPMGGPTNIDYEKIKKNPMATKAGEQGVDWRPFGPGPKDYFDTDKFGRPMKEGEMDEDMLSAKQKKFAALAEPKDKITYADKIAGAKKSMKEDSHGLSLNTPLKHAINQLAEQGIASHIRRFFEHARDSGAFTIRDALKLANSKQHIINAVKELLGGDQDSVGDMKEGNKFSGNLAKARAQGLKQADLDGDGDLEPVHEVEQVPYHPLPKGDSGYGLSSKDFPGIKDISQYPVNSAEYKVLRAERDEKIRQQSQAAAAAAEKAQADKEAKRGPIGRVGSALFRGMFGQELPEGQKSMREGWEEMQKYLEKKKGPESKGGAGKKAGTRYGGSAQKDDDEMDGEGKPIEKKKGRPKGTGGGAKHSFKKPKD